MFKFLNKGISTPIAIGIILILSVILGSFTLLQYSETEKELAIKLPEIKIPEKKEVKEETAGWKTYRDEEYGFEIKYPLEWKTVSEFPGRLGPGQTEFIEGVNPQSFIFAPNSKDLTKNEADVIFYVAPGGYFDCSRCTNLSNNSVNEFLKQNIAKDEIEFCKSNIYFRFSVTTPQKEIFDQMLSTFRFIEENYVKYGSGGEKDLNNDGKSEKIEVFYSTNTIEGYVVISTLNKEGNYEELGRMDVGTFFSGGTNHPLLPMDINEDSIKEIFNFTVEVGGSAQRELYKILSIDFDNKKLNWIKFQGGDIQDNTLEEWGYRGVCSYNRYIFDKDINNNNKKEVIGFSAAPCGLDVAPPCLSNSLCDKEELKDKKPCRECSFSVYEWDGSKFLYNQNLSKLAQEKIDIEEFSSPDLGSVCDVCIGWK